MTEAYQQTLAAIDAKGPWRRADGTWPANPIEIPNCDRDDLATWFGECGFRTGAEIGVETGQYAEVLCRQNPGLHLYAVDAWAPYFGYREHVTAEKLEGFVTVTKARLASYHVTYLRQFSVEAAKGFKDGALDFVYVDANHDLPHVIEDMCAWLPKVRSGGILAGHDFGRRKKGPYLCHVVEAVIAWTEAYHIAPWWVVGSKDVRPGEKRDRPRSWFFVKE